jgi:serine protease
MTRGGNGAFAVSGTIFAAEATFADSDVNDTSTVPVSNDTNATAQILPVPSTVGGYVNVHHSGPAGNSFATGDEHDLYLVSLRAGQVVVLVIGDDSSVVDLDLSLSGQALATPIKSEGTGPIEMIVAPADGSYFIDVYPYLPCQCASTYTLSIGQTVPAAAARAERTDVEFVPGQLIVKLRAPEVTASGAAGALRQAKPQLPKELGLEQLGGDSSREMLVRLPSGAASAATFQALGAAAERQKLVAQSLSSDELARRETILALKALRKRPEIASVELNTIMRPSFVPADPYYNLQWNYPLIHMPQAWDIVTGDPNVIVAVVDTGVRLDHPDLQGQLVPGYDFISDPTRARDGNGIDPDPNDPGDRGAGAGTSSFHGTHVAGTIAAATNNGIGVAGIAFGARVMPVRVLGVNGGTQFDVMQGVRYAAGLENDSGTMPPKRADVINLSLGGGGFSQAAQDVFTEARANGVIVVAAAGNDASSAPSFPASYDGVVSVAAVDLNRNPAPYSNFGPNVDVAAPGGDTSVDRNGDGYADGILSTLVDDSVSPPSFVYAFYQGTSMATPHVSGVFALMRSADPNISPATIDTLLAMGSLTDDIGAAGRDDRTGWGLIDARAAVLAAGAPNTGPLTPLSVTPSGLNFGLSIDMLDFIVANAGSDPLTVTSVSIEDPNSAPWLSLVAADVDGAGLGRYRATVNRTVVGPSPKSYAATIDVVSSAGTAHLPVVMRVGGMTSSDAGFQYVLLVDSESLEPIDEVAVGPVDGTYSYAFANVPQGNYLVIAGTDLDNDSLICDPGEACGSYPTLDLPTPVTVDHDITGADFGTAFRQSIRTGVLTATPVPAQGIVRRSR